MNERISSEDVRFVADLEAGTIPPSEFNHRAHVRLAYAYLAAHDPESATARMRRTLLSYLEHHGVPATKYHETITTSWILAVRHFMARTETTHSADEFIEANPELLDSRIMLTHYSADLLFSDAARATFVEPDLDPIPRHDSV